MKDAVRRALCLGIVLALALTGSAGAAGRCGNHPWCDTSLSPDQRADLLLGALTRDEKPAPLGGDALLGGTGGPAPHTGTTTGVARGDLPNPSSRAAPGGPRGGRAPSMPAP